MRGASLCWLTLSVACLSACAQEPTGQAEDQAAQLPEAIPAEATEPNPASVAAAAEIGTPMEERVATLGLLNKRNNSSRDIEIAPGETQDFGDIRVTLSACEKTAPWEMQRETGAFVQVDVRQRGSNEFERIFSGWLFKESPSLNVVEHQIYDVWVKDCAMSFPGEE